MSRSPLVLAAVAILGVAFLALGAGWIRETSAPEPVADAIPDGRLVRLTRRVDELAQRLEEETTRRIALEEKLAARLAVAGNRTDAKAAETRGDVSSRPPERRRPAGRPARASGFDPEPLIESGFPQRDVEAYADALDAFQLEQLELRDRATREGWVQTPRYAEANRTLSEDLVEAREAYGDEFADWVLFASGRPNRLKVGAVIDGSAGATAGLQAGDVVERYAGAPIRGFSDLRGLTTTGVAGESTDVEVRRDGRTIRLTVPRGPLGVSVEPVQQEPQPPR